MTRKGACQDVSVFASLLIAASLIASVASMATPNATIKLGLIEPLHPDAGEGVISLAKATGLGTRAAFHRINNIQGGVNGRQVEIISKVTDFEELSYRNATIELMRDHPDTAALFGSIGDTHWNRIKPQLEEFNLPNLGPFSGDVTVRGYHPNSFFIRPDPWAEMVASVTEIISHQRKKRIAIMHCVWTNDGSDYGMEHVRTTTKLVNDLGGDIVHVFTVRMLDPKFNMMEELGAFLLAEPDVVFVYGSPEPQTVEFMIGCLVHPLAPRLVPNLKFYISETLAIMAPIVFKTAQKMFPDKAAQLLPENRVVSTFTFPLITDTSYRIVQDFHTDMATTMGPEYLKHIAGIEYATVSGYITSRWVGEVLSRVPGKPTRASIMKTLHASSTWEVSDVNYGIFKGECSHPAETHCRCNEGAHLVDLGSLDSSFQWQKLANASYKWDYATCTGKDIKMKQQVHYLELYNNASALEQSLVSLMRSGKAAAEATASTSTHPSDYVSRSLNGPSSIPDQIVALNSTLITTVVAQSTIGDTVELPWPNIDPFTPRAALAAPFNENVMYTHATLQQEFHTLSAYAAHHKREIHLVAADDVSAAFSDLFERSATTFRISSSVTQFPLGQLSADVIPTSATVLAFVCGVTTTSDVEAIIAALVSNSDLVVAVAASEYQAQYDSFLATLRAQSDGGVAAAKRLVAATSMPNWGSAAASVAKEGTLLYKFNASLPAPTDAAPRAAQAHPLKLRAFIATKALLSVLEYLPNSVVPSAVRRTWFDISTVMVDKTLALGPYFDAACPKDVSESAHASCECNVGPRRVHVFTTASVADMDTADTSFHSDFMSCHIEYTRPAASGAALSIGAIVGVTVAGISLVTIAGVAYMVIIANAAKRDTSCAPTDPSQPYTLVFTDIQNSTGLWARVPQEMGPALDTHHEIIRGLIKKYNGYEVKTIGDAFMIAFKSPDDAVDLCEGVQQEMFKFDWGTQVLDQTYQELEQERMENDPDCGTNLSCMMPEALYGKSWNGLRVRCGIHTGIGDIKFDDVTLGYDYYGTVANTAARTEAAGNGGQILITADTMKVLKERRVNTDLGMVPLRGLTEPVQLFQIDVVSGRLFAPLRLSEEKDDVVSVLSGGSQRLRQEGSQYMVDSSDTGEATTITGSQCNSFQDEDLYTVSDVLDTLFSNVSGTAKKTMVHSIASKWRVGNRHAPTSATEVDDLLVALKRRIAGVLNKKQETLPRQRRTSRTVLSNSSMELPSPTKSSRQGALLAMSTRSIDLSPPSPAKEPLALVEVKQLANSGLGRGDPPSATQTASYGLSRDTLVGTPLSRDDKTAFE